MIKLSSSFVLIVLLAMGCNQKSLSPEDELKAADNTKKTHENFDKLLGKWLFTGYLKDKTTSSKGEATIEFTPTQSGIVKVTGRAFLNQYWTAWGLNSHDGTQSTITVEDPLWMTLVAGSTEIMKAEATFLTHLKNVKNFSVDDQSLKLYVGEPASEIMYFKK